MRAGDSLHRETSSSRESRPYLTADSMRGKSSSLPGTPPSPPWAWGWWSDAMQSRRPRFTAVHSVRRSCSGRTGGWVRTLPPSSSSTDRNRWWGVTPAVRGRSPRTGSMRSSSAAVDRCTRWIGRSQVRADLEDRGRVVCHAILDLHAQDAGGVEPVGEIRRFDATVGPVAEAGEDPGDQPLVVGVREGPQVVAARGTPDSEVHPRRAGRALEPAAGGLDVDHGGVAARQGHDRGHAAGDGGLRFALPQTRVAVGVELHGRVDHAGHEELADRRDLLASGTGRARPNISNTAVSDCDIGDLPPSGGNDGGITDDEVEHVEIPTGGDPQEGGYAFNPRQLVVFPWPDNNVSWCMFEAPRHGCRGSQTAGRRARGRSQRGHTVVRRWNVCSGATDPPRDPATSGATTTRMS